MKKLIAILAVVFVSGCTDANEAERVLDNAGFSDIQTHGYAFFSCGKDDFYHTKFTATNPNGKRVAGVVCSGLLFKDSTTRF